MKTVLLVAGKSKRFAPLAEKSFFPVAGKPLIAHVVERLEKAGCGDITFVGGKHNMDLVRMRFPDATVVEQEDEDGGMRAALLSALPAIGEDDVLVVSANDVVDASAYRATVEAGRQKGRGGALLAQVVSSYFPGGYLSVKGDRITGIVEKPGAGKEPSNLVTIVCHHHASAAALLVALKSVNAEGDDGYERALAMLFAHHSYAPVAYEGPWQAVKYPWHLLEVLPVLLTETPARIDPSASVHPSAVIEGNVTLEEGVRVLPHATIKGPAHIGAHSIVGNNALVRGSSVGEHCVIGYGTEVKDSILHDHVWTHSTYLGDSVVGTNVSFGAGCVTGNLRFDEEEIFSLVGDEKISTGRKKFGAIVGDDCRIGIRTAINPGVKIGAGSFVAGGCIVEHDLPRGSFARMKGGEIAVKPNEAQAPMPEARNGFRKRI